MTAEDVAQVVQIQQSITRQEVSARWRNMLASHVNNADSPGFVAEDSGKVLGFIIGGIKVGGFGTELTGWIEMMGVAPDQMGAGVGRALARAVFDYFKGEGVQEVCTAVLWDSGDMLAFFKNLGFDRSPFINLHLQVGG
jgi:L-amino acid N-acyltransferase YncA